MAVRIEGHHASMRVRSTFCILIDDRHENDRNSQILAVPCYIIRPVKKVGVMPTTWGNSRTG